MLWSHLLFGLFIFLIIHNEVKTSPRKHRRHRTNYNSTTAKISSDDEVVKISGRRIIGSMKARDNKFPFLGYLEYDGRVWCGVNIIHPRWVVTAAHCLDMRRDWKARVTLGNNRYRGGRVYHVEKFYVHPAYRHRGEESNGGLEYLVNDIGLIRIQGDIHFDEHVRPVKLPRVGDLSEHAGEWVNIAGWGNYYLNSPTPDDLLTASAEVISAEQCRAHWRYIENDHICTKVNYYTSICYGDSGGPLVTQDGVLIGIASTADTDCGFVKPNLFVKVGSYVHWIKKILNVHGDHLYN